VAYRSAKRAAETPERDEGDRPSAFAPPGQALMGQEDAEVGRDCDENAAPPRQLTAAGRSSFFTPGSGHAAIASQIASMAGIRVKLLRHASTTRRSGTGSSNGT
jgi:hypothetical protein